MLVSLTFMSDHVQRNVKAASATVKPKPWHSFCIMTLYITGLKTLAWCLSNLWVVHRAQLLIESMIAEFTSGVTKKTTNNSCGGSTWSSTLDLTISNLNQCTKWITWLKMSYLLALTNRKQWLYCSYNKTRLKGVNLFTCASLTWKTVVTVLFYTTMLLKTLSW